MSRAQISADRAFSVEQGEAEVALRRSSGRGVVQVLRPRSVEPIPAGADEAVPAEVHETDLRDHLAEVDALLDHTMSDLEQLWAELPDNGPVDILADCDLPALMRDLVGGGGKRLRPVMSYLGWLAAGGRSASTGRAQVVRVGAALELLHVFALVHDDVMDESMSRRGRPTVHVQAGRLHQAAAATGDGRRFGESIAILVGDLAHAEAGNLVCELPGPMRRLWRLMVAELVAGQRRDIAGSAAGRRDLSFARSVARMKSGRYTVERPLELGATAAEAGAAVNAALASYGRAVGEAFALRDDLLGIWGDPLLTGKPAGDDLISGKPTVILALAQQRLRSSSARSALQRVGSADFSHADLTTLMRQLEEEGIAAAVEKRISDHVEIALAALEGNAPAGGVLDPDGVVALTRMAHQIAWRDR
ncbi:geranylgeranyl diphosphate synthase type I [Nakamurella sp. UYEF19]|uniref:polyprenyl synthetase family protein n=1 Tax=Nakamurella sp. UYEF19 TaxID=1756392 RepID=UPI0033977E60